MGDLNTIKADERVKDRVHPEPVKELMADKKYLSNEAMKDFAEQEIRGDGLLRLRSRIGPY
jgi:hypothetical protein